MCVPYVYFLKQIEVLTLLYTGFNLILHYKHLYFVLNNFMHSKKKKRFYSCISICFVFSVSFMDFSSSTHTLVLLLFPRIHCLPISPSLLGKSQPTSQLSLSSPLCLWQSPTSPPPTFPPSEFFISVDPQPSKLETLK